MRKLALLGLVAAIHLGTRGQIEEICPVSPEGREIFHPDFFEVRSLFDVRGIDRLP